ncbi:uncharacterized protein LOC111341076 [Stylophora pistillata]|uniref:uncharacterized protein LOC111341076 n=1 Tax=Stylophora pistillata TaxID=50429 RepID=UPI000C03B9A4|nr:uncharacterized protein LOC111341076 [Stylophora pistillata]
MQQTKLGNIVVKEFLETNNVQLSRLKQFREKTPAARRRQNRTQGGEISVPLPRTNDQIRETLRCKSESGEYILGEMIVPETYKKVVLDKDVTIKTELFTVSGRKIPLSDIRDKTLKQHEKLGLMHARTDEDYAAMTKEQVKKRIAQLNEHTSCLNTATLDDLKNYLEHVERTRHLMVWADNSTLLNHGYLLLTVNAVFDKALYFTNKEMEDQGKGNVDVQSLVEWPQVYILARCGSAEAEQIAYINTRKACLQGLKNNVVTSNGVQITDVTRRFHSDGPQQEFESGEQKGGNAGCSGCSGDAKKYKYLSVSLSKPLLSLTDRLRKVIQGPAGRKKRNGGLKPFKNLHLEELREECQAMGLPTDGKKKDLEETLKEEMGGIQRVPAMMFFDQERTLEEINLGINLSLCYIKEMLTQ